MKNILLLLSLTLLACSPKQETLVTSKAKNNTQVNRMVAAFKQQKHRIELNGCTMRYNNEVFTLGMSIHRLMTIFGPYDLFNEGVYLWKKSGIAFTVEQDNIENTQAETVNAFINLQKITYDDYHEKLKHRQYTKKNYFLFEGIPINRHTRFNDFLNNSHYQLNTFTLSRYTYQLTFPCSDDTTQIEYFLSVDNIWKKNKKNQSTTKSQVNLNNANKIKEVFIQSVK